MNSLGLSFIHFNSESCCLSGARALTHLQRDEDAQLPVNSLRNVDDVGDTVAERGLRCASARRCQAWPERSVGGARRTSGWAVPLRSASIPTTRRSDAEKKEHPVSQRGPAVRPGDVRPGHRQPPRILSPQRYVSFRGVGFPLAFSFLLQRFRLCSTIFYLNTSGGSLKLLSKVTHESPSSLKATDFKEVKRLEEPDALQKYDHLNSSSTFFNKMVHFNICPHKISQRASILNTMATVHCKRVK